MKMKISPKVLDIQGNRVGDEIFEIGNIGGYDNLQKKSKEMGFRPYKDGLPHEKTGVSKEEHIGRFPTQLFTNIKKELYKYVKNIS